MKIKSRHGHYSNTFEEEARRIIRLYKEQLDINITYVEATAIAAERSLNNFWTDKKLKEVLSRLRGI